MPDRMGEFLGMSAVLAIIMGAIILVRWVLF